MKFANEPKNLFDIEAVRVAVRKLNALLNSKVLGSDGGELGQFFYADGNTVLQLAFNPDRWQKPFKEIDTDRAVQKGTWVYISPGNPIVVDGMTDPIGGSGTKAIPGIWEARKDVPASTGVDDYNVPQFPYPGATGDPTGTTPNYRGDLDGDDVFWILICPVCADATT